MSYKPNDEIIADYIGGELSQDETSKLEAYLAEHPDEKKEVEELKSMQSLMGRFGDKEVVAPSFVFEEAPSIVIAKHRSIDRFLKSSLAIAASLTLLFLVGYFTRFSISQGEAGLQLSFGEVKEVQNNSLNREDVKAWMQEALAENNSELINKINQVKTELDESKNTQLVSNRPSNVSVDKQLVDKYISELRLANRDIILGLLEDSERSQQEYLTGVMTDFASFMELQRQKDLDAIELQFSSLVNRPDDTNYDNYLNSE
ncbi:MAG: anti-sigma factor [Ekhidna sp.]